MCRYRDRAVGTVFREYGQWRFGTSIGIRIAAAIKIGLREDVGLGGLGERPGIDQRNFKRWTFVRQRFEVERSEMERQDHEVEQYRRADGIGEHPITAGRPQ